MPANIFNFYHQQAILIKATNFFLLSFFFLQQTIFSSFWGICLAPPAEIIAWFVVELSVSLPFFFLLPYLFFFVMLMRVRAGGRACTFASLLLLLSVVHCVLTVQAGPAIATMWHTFNKFAFAWHIFFARFPFATIAYAAAAAVFDGSSYFCGMMFLYVSYLFVCWWIHALINITISGE